ncbi:MAG: hypothetical protein AAF756_21020 [Pseudomonadota bacterium]
MIEGKLGVFNDPDFQRAGEAIAKRGIFAGCALDKFAATAKDLFHIAYDTGLDKRHCVLEVGGGCLRTGVWFIDFLEQSNYCCIEPNKKMLNAGKDVFLDENRLAKAPLFNHNEDFDLSVFKKEIDWVVGYSIWSHCSRAQIIHIIDQASSMGSRLLFSFAPVHPRRPEYTGEGWTGISHNSDTKGIAYHRVEWLLEVCVTRKMKPFVIPAVTGAQLWLYAHHASMGD